MNDANKTGATTDRVSRDDIENLLFLPFLSTLHTQLINPQDLFGVLGRKGLTLLPGGRQKSF
jgi:hypothetical protein